MRAVFLTDLQLFSLQDLVADAQEDARLDQEQETERFWNDLMNNLDQGWANPEYSECP